MKAYRQTKQKRVPARFARENRFALETELEQLKGRLLRDMLAEAPCTALFAPLRRATHEAAALAWTTPYPLLVLPELVREKADCARRYVRRQAALLRRGRPVCQ